MVRDDCRLRFSLSRLAFPRGWPRTFWSSPRSSHGGFDPARDIAGITVNRWSHGYSYSYDVLGDDTWYEDWNDPRYPHVQGRQPFGNISIANADAGAIAWLHVAVEQAHRAVNELIS